MARPKRNELATQDFHKAITKLARKNPANSKDIERWLIRNFDGRTPVESIRKALTGGVDPTACNVTLLFALRAFYGCEFSDLGSYAEKEMADALNLALSGTDIGPDLLVRASSWRDEHAGGDVADLDAARSRRQPVSLADAA